VNRIIPHAGRLRRAAWPSLGVVAGVLLLILSIAVLVASGVPAALASGPGESGAERDATAGGVRPPTALDPPVVDTFVEPTISPSGTTAVHTYWRITGNVMRPVDNLPDLGFPTYSYGAGGCLEAANGSYQAPMRLPDGAKITYIRIFYRNTVAGSTQTPGEVYLVSYDGAGVIESVAGVTAHDAATAGTGYLTELSAPVNRTVDNYAWAYVISWITHGTDQKFCGVRVTYDAP
jgi:hypothetical protein